MGKNNYTDNRDEQDDNFDAYVDAKEVKKRVEKPRIAVGLDEYPYGYLDDQLPKQGGE